MPPLQGMRRIAADTSNLHKHGPPPYYLFPPSPYDVHSDLSKLSVLLVGPEATPFSAGVFSLLLEIPSDYPQSPPTATFRTKIFHPNVDPSTGAVCVDTLKRDWRPELTLRDILTVIRCLLVCANPASALNAEAGKLMDEDYAAFEARARMWTMIHAACPVELRDEVAETRAKVEGQPGDAKMDVSARTRASTTATGATATATSTTAKKRDAVEDFPTPCPDLKKLRLSTEDIQPDLPSDDENATPLITTTRSMPTRTTPANPASKPPTATSSSFINRLPSSTQTSTTGIGVQTSHDSTLTLTLSTPLQPPAAPRPVRHRPHRPARPSTSTTTSTKAALPRWPSHVSSTSTISTTTTIAPSIASTSTSFPNPFATPTPHQFATAQTPLPPRRSLTRSRSSSPPCHPAAVATYAASPKRLRTRSPSPPPAPGSFFPPAFLERCTAAATKLSLSSGNGVGGAGSADPPQGIVDEDEGDERRKSGRAASTSTGAVGVPSMPADGWQWTVWARTLGGLTAHQKKFAGRLGVSDRAGDGDGDGGGGWGEYNRGLFFPRVGLYRA